MTRPAQSLARELAVHRDASFDVAEDADLIGPVEVLTELFEVRRQCEQPVQGIRQMVEVERTDGGRGGLAGENLVSDERLNVVARIQSASGMAVETSE